MASVGGREVIGNAHFFAEVVLCGSEQEYMDYLLNSGFSHELARDHVDGLRRCGGGAALIVDRDTLQMLKMRQDIGHQEKNGISLGGHVVAVNFFGLTPEELFAVAAHESGHIACRHKHGAGRDLLTMELEADRMAAYEVGPDLIKAALVKLRNALTMEHSAIMVEWQIEQLNMRIGALTF